MGKQYKIAYATGSRADYGIVRNYLAYLDKDPEIDFSVLVTGSHVDARFGNTASNIEADGFRIDLAVDLHIDTLSTAHILESVAVATEEFGRHFESTKYDLLILLGDRYEMLAVAIAAAMQKIPILHLHGGEVTYGNYDEFIRHCITKMSRFHFASTEVYRQRIIQMGEDPRRVFNMGALGAENCKHIDIDKVQTDVKALPKKQYFVIAFHPETLTDIDLPSQVDTVICGVDSLRDDYQLVLIGTNADTGSGIIREKWLAFAEKENVHYFESLNADSYLYLVKNSVCLVGNSSSGIIEAPSLGVYTVNIGDRQKGRVHGESVMDVPCEEGAIRKALDTVIRYSERNLRFDNPYDQENVAFRCYEQTKALFRTDMASPKEFYDFG